MPILFKSLILIIFLVGIIVLQIFLSKRENKWFGLILPMVNIIVSLMAVYSMAFFQKESITEIILQVILIFLLWNISTVILFVVYLACREKVKKKKELDKMNIQDVK